jgi:hypothetical protein
MPRKVRLTRLLISTSMEPETWFEPSAKSFRIVDRLQTDLGRLPFSKFPSKDSFLSLVQLVRESRNAQSCASSQFSPQSN